MEWLFEPFSPRQVESEITQQDQFRNEEVDLPETLVRESIQNSMDARAGTSRCARVTFRFVSGEHPEGNYVRELFNSVYRQHAKAAGVDLSCLDRDPQTALVIEDFGTTGLTGRWDMRDEDDFSDFWRRHGITHKSKGKQGRRGLGKLVYSASSRLHAFLGLTVRGDGDADGPLLMGQAVLCAHETGGIRYHPHGFFSPEGILHFRGHPCNKVPERSGTADEAHFPFLPPAPLLFLHPLRSSANAQTYRFLSGGVPKTSWKITPALIISPLQVRTVPTGRRR